MTVTAMTPPYIGNTIVLKSPAGQYEELPADSTLSTNTISPGHLIQVQSGGGVVPHSVMGGVSEKLFAKEDSLQGHWLNDTYGYSSVTTIGDLVPYIRAMPGDHILAIFPANCPAVADGQGLISNGDGTLIPTGLGGGPLLYANAAPSTVLTSWTTKVAFAGIGYTAPANFFQAGDVLNIKCQAIAIAINSTNTFVLTLQIGTVVIIATAAVNNTANDIIEIDAQVVFRTVGASGTLVAEGTQTNGTPGTATALPFLTGSSAINTTGTLLIDGYGTMSVSNAGNQYRIDVLTVELLRGTPNALVAYSLEAFNNSANSTTMRQPVRIAG